MGTNYYHRTDICECCGRYKEQHIGKSSMGWQFSFQGYNGFEDLPKIVSFGDWKKELQAGGKIFNEYGEELSFEDFVERVESKQTEKFNHYDHCKEFHQKHAWAVDMSLYWQDEDGYDFSSADFC